MLKRYAVFVHISLLLIGLLCLQPTLAQAVENEAADNGAADNNVVVGNVAPLTETPAPVPAVDLETLLAELITASYSRKEALVDAIAGIDDRRVLPILKAFLSGDLYARKTDDRAVFVVQTETGYQLTDALTQADLGQVGRRDVKKVAVNNTLRSKLQGLIARLSLADPDPAIRAQAAKDMIGAVNNDNRADMESVLARETDANVVEILTTALAVADLKSADMEVQLQAIQRVRGSLRPETRQLLADLAEQAESAQVQKAAASALASIESKLKFYSLVETTFFGLSLGSVLLLAAIGLAITFGVMGVINMAHGELIMLGAYTTYVVQLLMPNALGWSLLVAIPAAFIVSGLFGIAIERGVIRFLYGRPLETLLATFGISLVLQQLVRTIFSPLNRSVSTPDWMSGSLQVNAALSITYNRLYIIIFSLIVFVALLIILRRTVLGLQVRAVAQNRSMAKAMGIRTEWVDAMTFGLGSGIAGVAGVALSQLTNVGPNLGQSYIIDSFMVVVFGGVGNLWGTLVGAMSLGVANKFLEPYSGAVLAKILVLIFIILFIQKRPRGLFPQQGRGAEN